MLPMTEESDQYDLASPKALNVLSIQMETEKSNAQQLVRNVERFGPVDEDTIVIAILVLHLMFSHMFTF